MMPYCNTFAALVELSMSQYNDKYRYTKLNFVYLNTY